MSSILTHATEEELTAANEANFFRLLVEMVSAFSRGRIEVSEDQTRFWTGINYAMCNGVVGAQLEEDSVIGAVQENVEFFRKIGMTWMWVAGPSSSPAGLQKTLEKVGAKNTDPMPGMVLDLEEWPVSQARGLATTRMVEDEELASSWADALCAVYHVPFEGRDMFLDLLRVNRFQADAPYRAFVAESDGKVVATSSLYFSDGVAGIYCVGTLEEARRLGAGTAVTLAAIQAAKESGYRYVTLQASEMGRPIYERLGFRSHCNFSMYLMY